MKNKVWKESYNYIDEQKIYVIDELKISNGKLRINWDRRVI